MSAAAEGARRAMLRAARAILRPLVRQLIAHGVTYPTFNRLAKEVYIEVGTRHFTLPFKQQTDSRVALVTGITRKEIGQVRRGLARPGAALDADHTLPARVVARWLAGPPFADEAGKPRLLVYEADDDASFAALVAELGGDIPARAVLDELLRVGAAKLTPRGDVRLVAAAYLPAQGVEEKIAMLGSDGGELLEAIAHNLEHPDDAFLQRKVLYDNIGAEALPELRATVRRLGGEFAQAINRVIGGFDRDRNPDAPGGERSRAVVVVHYFDAPLPARRDAKR